MSDLREKLFYEKKNGYDRIGTEERLCVFMCFGLILT